MKIKKTSEDLINEELDEIRYAWKYQGERFIFTFENLKGYTGFVYLITNKVDGRKYIGQKLFSRAKTTQKSGRKLKSRVESTWKMYYGSNKELNEDVKRLGRDNFERRILYLCKSKTEMNYLESLEIFRQEALLSDDYYNLWVSCKISGKYLKDLKENPMEELL
jgi:hypothetical protein